MSTSYITNNLIAGDIKTQQVKFASGTYKRGMALEYDASNDRYKMLSTGDIAGIFLGEDRTLANDEYDSVIIGGEVYAAGILNSSGTALTITEDMIAAWAARGFYIKRK
jgi:peptide subunit release factor RF-3